MIAFANFLAQSRVAEKFQKLRGGFNDRPTDPADLTGVFLAILIPISFVLMILLLRHVRSRYKQGHSAPARPARLFDMVLKKMGIRFTDRFLLRAMARSAHLNHPTVLFFSRDIFERHSQRWIDKLTVKSLQRHAKLRIAVISDLAFGPKSEPSPADALASRDLIDSQIEIPPPFEADEDGVDATRGTSETAHAELTTAN